MPRNNPLNPSRFFSLAGDTAKSALKLLLARGGARPSAVAPPDTPLIIMANGPSLRKNLDEDASLLASSHTMAVNFAANAPEFRWLKPRYYILADPHFFSGKQEPNLLKLMEELSKVDWPMTLLLPKGAKMPKEVGANSNIRVERFPFHAFESFTPLQHKAFDLGWGMPRPRNVLIPAIMCGIWLGYKQIYLLGTDHSWTQTLSVNSRNQVVSIQPHFYKEDKAEEARVTAVYENVRLHEILDSFRVAFRSYHTIAAYANARGVEILNSTPGSFIDAFPRSPLPHSATH